MGIYVFKAYPLPNKEEAVLQIMREDHPAFPPYGEDGLDHRMVTGETDSPLPLMRKLKGIVSYMWAYNPNSWDADQGDYADRCTMEFQQAVGNL